MKLKTKEDYRRRRHVRLRQRVHGTPERPRMVVRTTLHHAYVQFVDDTSGRTLAAVSTMTPAVRAETGGRINAEATARLGTLAAQQALTRGVQRVVFDRGGCRYGKRLRALADAARAAGLEC